MNIVILLYVIDDVAELHLFYCVYCQPSVDSGDGDDVKTDGITVSIFGSRLFKFFDDVDDSMIRYASAGANSSIGIHSN